MASSPTAVTVAETVEKAPRKFPAPCWTQEETLCLIEAYRERWYALRRGYLRTPDWDEVATAVSTRCPAVSPAKTSAQCRHKIEKLRQRYRAEKQRALSYPYPAGRYFSSWFFFDHMEAMENGTTPPTPNPSDGSRLKSFLDDNIVKLKAQIPVDSSPLNFALGNGIRSDRSKISSDYSSYYDEEEDDLIHISRGKPVNEIPTPPLKLNGKNANRIFRHEMLLPKSDRSSNQKFCVNNNISDSQSNYWGGSNSNGGMNNGLKRGRNAIEEIADSIRILGEGFVKMERAKMEMAREVEVNRMEMEVKRNEMLLESQKQIVDAFVKGLFEMKKTNKKVKAGLKAEADSAGI